MKPTGKPSFRRFCVLLLMLVSYTNTYVVAAPKGGRVVSGTATFQQDGNLTVITAGNRSIINYGSFNIAAGETVRFVQPGANSSVLNRVVGSASPTEIFGSLQANGHVFLVNPYGIFFRNGSVINVGGLYAGAGNLSDANFTKGKVKFTDLAGDVRNDGLIAADNRIALMGANVVNTGSLKAGTGMAMMVSGKDVYVGEKNGNIFVQANGRAAASAVTSGAASRGSVVNTGTVAAPRILIGGGDLYSTAISNSGLLQGRQVTINAGRGGTAAVGGTVDATGPSNGTATGRGGRIQVLGGEVALRGATLDASGPAGGGSVRVGGDAHGGGTLAHSATTTVDAGTTIRADATGPTGDGGSVVLWSDHATNDAGRVSVRGGSTAGDGGAVEVSSAGQFAYHGQVDAAAPGGQVGSLLFDPANIRINLTGTAVGSDPADTTTLSAADVQTLFNNAAAVTLAATRDIRVGATVLNLDLSGGTGDVTFQAGTGGTGSFVTGAATTVTAPGRNVSILAASASPNDARGLNDDVPQAISLNALSTAFTAAGTPPGTGNGGSITLYTGGSGGILFNRLDSSSDGAGGNGGTVVVGGDATRPPAAGTINAGTVNTAGGAGGLLGTINLRTVPAGSINFAAAPTFTGDTTVATGSVVIGGGGQLNGGGHDLTLTLGNPFSLGDIVTNSVRNLLSDGAGSTNFDVGAFATTGSQTYNNAVTLSADTVLTAANNGGVIFGGALNSSFTTANGVNTTTAHTLTINTGGATQVNAALGGTYALGGLTTDAPGGTVFNVPGGPAVTTVNNGAATGAQTYNDPVAVSADTILTSRAAAAAPAAGGTVTFARTVDATGAGGSLTVNNSGATVFGGAVGGGVALSALTTDAGGTTALNGGSVRTSGTQTYNDPVTLGAATTLTAGGLTVGSTFNGAGRDLVLTIGGNVTVPGNLTNLNNFTSNGAGGTTLFGSFTTTGSQLYDNAVTLGGASVLTAGTNGSLTFNATVRGPFDLTLNPKGTGSAVFQGGVGGTLPADNLRSLTVNGTTNVAGGGAVTTSGLQNYAGPLTLGVDTTLKSTGSTVTVGGATTGSAHDLTVSGTGSSFAAINGAGDLAFDVGTGTAAFSGTVGAASLVRSGTGLTDFTAALNVNTASDTLGQSYGGPVRLGGATTLFDASGGPITLSGAVNGTTAGGQSLTVNTGGTATFGGVVGNLFPLGSLTTDVGGTTILRGGGATTTGAQTYNDALTLGADTILASTTAGGILLRTTVDGGGHALTVNTAGTTTFGGALTALGSLTTDADGRTALNAGTVATTGAQTYRDAVTLGADTRLTLGAGSLTFGKTLDSDAAATPRALEITATGTQTFTGAVGTVPLARLATGTGPAVVGGGSVTTNGTQTYVGPLTLTNNLVLATKDASTPTGTITFNSTVRGGFGLTTSTAGGNTVFGANSGSDPLLPLGSLTTSAQGSTVFNNAALTTTGTQNYQGPVVVARSATNSLALTSTVGNVRFGNSLSAVADQPSDLTIRAPGNGALVTFEGPVGGSATFPSATALNSLSVTAATINLNGGVVNTASTNPLRNANDGLQTYNGAVVLGRDTTFVGRTVTAAPGVDARNHDLTLTLSGLVTVPLGPTFINVNGFTSNGTGGTDIAGSFATGGFQHYDNATTVSAPSTLTAGTVAGQDSFRFGSTLDSLAAPAALTLNTAGTALLSGAVGGRNPLASLVVNSGPIRLDSGAVTTTGRQLYGGAVALGPSSGQTTLTSQLGGEINFVSTVDGGTPGTQRLTTSTAQGVTFGGFVGGTNPLIALAANNTGTTTINGGGVTTVGGGQVYQGPVVFDGAALTTLSDSGGGALFFGGTVNNFVGFVPTVTLGTAGSITLQGAVGNIGPLGNLLVNADGGIALNGGSVRTGGTQAYTSSTGLTLGAFAALSAGGAVTFDTTVDGSGAGGQGLTLNTPGIGSFNQLVGSKVPLAGLTTDAGGQTRFNMLIGTAPQGVNVTGNVVLGDPVLFAATGSTLDQPTVRTGGLQSYAGGTATQDTALVGGGSFGNGATLDLAGHDLSLRFGGVVAVPGNLAGVRNFVSDGTGGTLVNGTFTTGGTQTYGNPVTLAGTPVLNAVGSLIFNSTVDGAAPLVLNVAGAAGQAVFKGLVGGSTALLSLTSTTAGGTAFGMNAGSAPRFQGGVNVGAGGLTVNGPTFFAAVGSTLLSAEHPTVLSVGPQLYNDAVVLQADTALVAGGASPVTFGGTTDGAFSLAVATGGDETFNGLVGSNTPLKGLTTDGFGNVGGEARFSGTVGGARAGVVVDGSVTLNDAARFGLAGSTVAQPSVLTLNNGTQFYAQGVVLADQTVFTSTAGNPAGGAFVDGGQITFNGPVASPTGARQNLYVRTAVGQTQLLGKVDATRADVGGALVTFAGSVGPVGVFSVQPNTGSGGSVSILGGVVTTTGPQVYGDRVILNADTVLTAGGDIVFNQTVDSDALATPRALTLNTGALTIFNGLVGSTAPLLGLTTDNQGAAGEGTQFNLNLVGSVGAVAGVRVVNGVTINDPVRFNVQGSTATRPAVLTGVSGGVGFQTYASAATLAQNTVLTNQGVGDITFGGAVDGAFGLIVNSGGDEVFNGLVGNLTPLASLRTDAAGPSTGSTRFNLNLGLPGTLAGVRVTGAVDVGDAVVFNAANNGGTVPTIFSGGAQTYLAPGTVARNTILDGGKADLVFSSTLDGPFALVLNTAGVTRLGAAVGGIAPLASLTTDAPGSTLVNADRVVTTGAQTYRDPVLLGRSATFASTGAGTLRFDATVDGPFNLTANTAGTAQFNAAVGGKTPLGSLTTDAGGTTLLNAPAVTTTNNQVYNDAVQLGTDVVLRAGPGGGLLFNGTVDGAFTLTATAGASTRFNGVVGGNVPLAALLVNGTGQTILGGRAVTTSGAQTFGGAVLLLSDNVLRSTAGGPLFFASTLDGTFALTLSTAGTTRLDGTVGGQTPLGSLSTDAGGTTLLNAGGITTTGAQTFGDVTVLLRDHVLTSTGGGNLAFRGPLDGAYNLNLNTAGTTRFDASVGGTAPLAVLRTDAPGSTRIGTGTVTTTAAQFYNDAVVLAADVLLVSVGPGGSAASGQVRFAGTVDSDLPATPRALTVNTTLATTFNGPVGGVVPLASLLVNAGVINVNGGGITTVNNGLASGAQTYNGPVLAGHDAVFASLAGVGANPGGSLTFNSTLDGAAALTLNTGGLTIFNGLVGSLAAPTSLTTDNTGAPGEETRFNMAVGAASAGVLLAGPLTVNDALLLNVAGAGLTRPTVLTLNNADQFYNGPVVLGTDADLVSAAALPAPGAAFVGGGQITFNSPAGVSGSGGRDLFVRGGVGTTRFNAAVNVGSLDLGGARAVFNGPVNLPGVLSVVPNDGGTAGAIALAGGGLTTSGAQVYRVGVILGADTVLTSLNTAGDGGNLVFRGTLDSDNVQTPRALALNTSGDEVFNGLVGSRAALGSLVTDAAGPVGGTARFAMDLTGTTPGTAGVNVQGAVITNDGVRFNVPGSSLADATHPTVRTGGGQSYRGAAVLARDTSLLSTGGGTLGFGGTLDGAFNLALSSGGDEVFNGLVGRAVPLASLTTDATGPATGQARFNLDTAGSGAGVNVAGDVTVNDGVFFGAGGVALAGVADGATILSGGTQTYRGAATLAQDTVLSSRVGDLRFQSTLDGPFGLTTNGTAFHDFNGLVGSVTAPTSLTTNGGTTRFNLDFAGSSATAGLRINGPLTVNGAVFFNVAGGSVAQPSVLTLGPAAQTYRGAVTLARNTVLTGGGDLLFASAVDGGFDLALNAAGATTLDAAVGGVVPLASLTTDGRGSTVLNAGTVRTTGLQAYGDHVVLARGTVLTSTDGGNLVFRSDVNGAADLTLNTVGNNVFNGRVGNVTPLANLTTDGPGQTVGGTTIFNVPDGTAADPSVRTSGAQTYRDGLTLRAGAVLSAPTAPVTAASVTGDGFALLVNADRTDFGRIDHAGTLDFRAANSASFNGPVSAASLTVLGGVAIALNAGTITTEAGQTYTSPLVMLGQDTVVQAGEAANFVGTLDAANHAVTLTAASAAFGPLLKGGDLLWTVPGETALNGPLTAASLRVNGSGGVTLANGGPVTTSGDQIFTGRLVLGADSALTSRNGTVNVGSLLGNRRNLTVTAPRTVFGQVDRGGALDFAFAGTSRFNGSIVARSLNVAGNATLNGGSIRTDGDQTFRGNVSLGAGTTLVSKGGGITSRQTLNGNGQAFSVEAPTATFGRIDGTGTTLFTVSGTTTLRDSVDAASLRVGGTGTLALNAGRVTTSAFQAYAQPVVLGLTTSLASTGAGEVSFAGTLDGAQSLTVDTAGNAVFAGAVGGNTRLASLNVATGNAAVSGGLVQTTGSQSYNGVVTVSSGDGAGTRLLSDTSDLVFNRDLNGVAGSLLVQGHRVLVRGDSFVNSGSLSLNAVERPEAPAGSSLLLLDGRNYVSNGGNVVLNGAENLGPGELASIVFTNPGAVNVRGSDFSMGYLQKVLAAGSLNIDVGRGQATVGDLAARQSLRVGAREIVLLNRPPGVGTGQRPNTGLNFVADQAIDFGEANLTYGRPENQAASFITTTGNVTLVRREGLSIFKDPNLDTQFRNAFTRGENGAFLVANPFQPVGGGSQTLDTAAALSGALPDQKPLDVPVDVTITSSQMAELRKLGIHPRKAQSRERGGITSRQALFAQLVDGQDPDNYGQLQPVKGGINRLVPSDYVVVVDRMSEREVQSILAAFEALYGKNKEKAPEIGAAYQQAFDAYSAEKQTADPAGFAPYLREKAGQYPAVDTAARGFDNLFGYIEHMGLTSVEVTKAESYIVSDLNVSGPSPDDMVRVINGQRQALPPARQAPSTKVPPAPPINNAPAPAASPAPGAAPVSTPSPSATPIQEIPTLPVTRGAPAPPASPATAPGLVASQSGTLAGL